MYSAMLALATSCTNELEDLSVQEAKSNGLTFKAEIENVDSRAELVQDPTTKIWNMFWYAEDDKLAIFGKDINKVTTFSTPKYNWHIDSKIDYKASRTLGEGYFVADGTNTFEFLLKSPTEGYYKPSFRYVWPNNVDVVTTDACRLKATLPAINAQDQTDLNGSSTVKYAFMSGKMDQVEVPANAEKYSASDVLIGMKIMRKFPLALYSVKNYDKNLHGKLVSITLTSLGQLNDAGTAYADNTQESLDYGTDATWDLVNDKKLTDGTNEEKSVVLAFNNYAGIDWSDDATAFMTFNTVDRSENTKPSWMKVEYEFENITFTDIFSSKANYVGHQAYRMSGTTAKPQYDLQAEPYLVVKNGSKYALVINPSFTGNVASIFDANGDVKDPFNSTITYAVSTIDRLVVYPDVVDPTSFAKLTSLNTVELYNETELHTGMFNASITKLVADKVVKVNKLFNTANGITPNYCAYENLSLASYLFKESDAINTLFFNDVYTKASLKTLNISGVKDMIYPFQNISLVFEDYTSLKEVTLNPTGVNVGQKAFKNCTALDKVNGKVNLSEFDATEAFYGTAIEKIDVIGTSVPSYAFYNCSILEEFTFVPSTLRSINEYAFYGCSSLEYVDLTNITTLGQAAFNMSALKSANKNTNLLTVGATSIPFAALANTKIEMVRFTRATTIGNKILKLAPLSQVRFDRPFTYINGTVITTTETFGADAKTVMLYVNKAAQKNVNGSKLSTPLSWNIANTEITNWDAIEFKGIYDNAYWGN